MELTKEFPFLFDTLVEASPKLKKLRNPILQRTIGRRATLTDVSIISKIPLRRILELLADSISANSDVSVTIDKDELDTGEWQEELERRQRSQ